MIEVLYEDAQLVAIDKPPGFHVHPPENSLWKVPREKICLYWVRDFVGAYVYPIHRLDAATGGILLFGKQPEAAAKIQYLIQTQTITKRYLSVLRGYAPMEGFIDKPLLSDSSDQLLSCLTTFTSKARLEIPVAVGKKHATSRYSLVEAEPKTGRYHQIRRHFAGISHPVVGDIKHGDSYHNRFFREQLQIPGLLLHCFELSFVHPYRSESITLRTSWSPRWNEIFRWFQYDPKCN